MSSKTVKIVAVNDAGSIESLAHLFKHDSVHGAYPGTVALTGNVLNVDRHKIVLSSETEIEKLRWKELGVDLVLECSGIFRSRALAYKHIKAGAKRVIVSAPCEDADITIVMGMNERDYDAVRHTVISNASCTTNCLGLMIQVLKDTVGVEKAFMTTIHAYTNDQRILDGPHRDLRRARAAGLSMIPTTSGATKSLIKMLPELKGAFEGLSIRVPTPNVSMIDLVAQVKKPVTVDQLNRHFKEASIGPLRRFLGYNTEPLVSIDFLGDKRSAVLDAPLTQVMDKRWVKLIAWYDNEVGFSQRMIDLAEYIHGH